MSRALARLRDILSRGGITAPENAIGSVLMANAVMRAPTALSSLAGTIAAPGQAALSTPPAIIAKGTLKAMAWGKAKWAAVTTLTAASVIVLAMYLVAARCRRQPEDGEGGRCAVRRTRADGPHAPLQIEAAYANKIDSRPAAQLGGVVLAISRLCVTSSRPATISTKCRRDGQEMTPLMCSVAGAVTAGMRSSSCCSSTVPTSTRDVPGLTQR